MQKTFLSDEENRPQNTAAPRESHSKSSKSSKNSGGGGDEPSSGKSSSRDQAKSQEEKRRHIKSIIDKIPTEKADLFNYPLDWNEIDATIEKKIRPWINKKIIEYIGEPEPTLVDFICSKVLAGSTPQGILDDVQMVRTAGGFGNCLVNLIFFSDAGSRRGSRSVCGQDVASADLRGRSQEGRTDQVRGVGGRCRLSTGIYHVSVILIQFSPFWKKKQQQNHVYSK